MILLMIKTSRWNDYNYNDANECENNELVGSVDDKVDPFKGRSLFYHENGRSSNFYYDATFQPIFDYRPKLPDN